ncbi:potassium channel subfamily K member 18 isoform X2 [Uranotaenia lowii]|uniref:potassium channel subfamily K member 18 isoform X2 n=1 Tax=Uranotaenia lowii TaxID=190385 RepID=UPI0024799A27|nr:potassium channel subfamily K member 18 isoform X2 [Uranotaenia lowii]
MTHAEPHTPGGPPPRPRINITVPPVYMAPQHVAQYSPAQYFQQFHQQHQNPLYQPPPSSPSRISMATVPDGQPPDYPDYYTMYPAKAGEFMFKQFEGFRDFTMNTAKSGLGVGEKSVFWLYTKITKWSRNWFTHIFLFLMLFLYSVAGAALFMVVEGEPEHEFSADVFALDENITAGTHEKRMETNVNHAKKVLAKNLRILALDREKLENPDTDLWEGRAINLVEEYSTVLYEAYKQGSFENKQNKKTWSFWNAVFYCGTVYTTIGYGHISPSTTTGRALTIIYAIIGIPIFLIVLADFGKLFTRGIKFLWAYVRRLYYTGSLRKVRKTTQVKEVMRGLNVVYDIVRRPSEEQELRSMGGNQQNAAAGGAPAPVPSDTTSAAGPTAAAGAEPHLPSTSGIEVSQPPTCESPTTPVPETFEIDDEFNLPISLAIFILVAYMLFGATIYFTWENWSFFEAFYFVFISISTIGFGDFVPQHPIYMMCSILYLIFGLALTSMCINVVQLKLSDSFRQASAKIGATIGLQMAEAASLHQQSQVHTPVDLAAVHTSTPTANGTHPTANPTSVNGDATMTPVLPERPVRRGSAAKIERK